MISALFFFARVTAIMLKFWEAAFFALDAMVLLRYLAGITRRLPRWVGVLPLLALAAMIAYIRALVISGGGLFLIFAGPAIVVTVVLFLATLPRLFLNSRAPAERGKTVKMLAAFAGLCLVVFSAERVIELRIMVAGQPRFESIRKESRQTDLRSMGWGKSFVALKEKLAAEYPFTQWKGIDWEARYSTFAPRIAQAEAAHDRRAYYLTLRELSCDTPCGMECCQIIDSAQALLVFCDPHNDVRFPILEGVNAAIEIKWHG